MGHIIQPGSSSTGGSWRGSRSFFLIDVVRQYRAWGIQAILMAAAVAFLPLAALIWFNVFRLSSVVATQISPAVVVRPGRYEDEREKDKPGETGLLQIICEVPTVDGWSDLLCDQDPVLRQRDPQGSIYVREERVYLRKAGPLNLPFGLLGPPPVCVWVPTGDYELAIVHAAPNDRSLINSPQTGFPFITVLDACSVNDREKTVRRIQLPHYDWGRGTAISVTGQAEGSDEPLAPDLGRLVAAIELVTPVPTPGGYVLDLPEPTVSHTEDHRNCSVDFENLRSVPREWTRNQLADLRRLLPASEARARDKLWLLIQALLRREMLEGWFSYALAGVSGLVMTKWGTLAILERYRRSELLGSSIRFCIVIFVISAIAWWFAGNP
ncbi:MAG: hypothetical protein JSS49_13625 [Planctomycetes bacterium]|nr:hypothetical protein [Planctomycetota bacterium]